MIWTSLWPLTLDSTQALTRTTTEDSTWATTWAFMPRLMPRLMPQFFPHLMPWYGAEFLQGFCFSSFNSCLVAGFNLGLHIGLNSFLNIVGFLVGFCLNMGQNWPGLKLPLVPQLRPRHGGFLASFYFLSSNVVFCFTCCFFCCFSTALASFSNMRQKNGFTLKEWGSSNAWYFRPIHLYLKNQV